MYLGVAAFVQNTNMVRKDLGAKNRPDFSRMLDAHLDKSPDPMARIKNLATARHAITLHALDSQGGNEARKPREEGPELKVAELRLGENFSVLENNIGAVRGAGVDG